MAIRLVCVCGLSMDLPAKYAGQQVQCPKCRAILYIPDPSRKIELLRWFCPCGQRLKAPLESVGRGVRCPKCSAEMTVPKSEVVEDAADFRFVLDSFDHIVRLTTAGSGPLAIAHHAEDEFEELIPDLEEGGGDPEVAQLSDQPSQPPSEAGPVSRMQQALQPEPEYISDFDDGEGVPPRNLSDYFNATNGKDAAVSGMTQVLNGHWLYIPYALLVGYAINVLAMLWHGTEGDMGERVVAAILALIAIPFFGAAFVGCIKDGIFERSMGMERLLYHGLMNVQRFGGTLLLMLPIWVAIGVAGTLAIGGAWSALPGPWRLLVIIPAALFGIFFFMLLLLPPVVSVLEKTNPLFAMARGVTFGIRNVGTLISLSIVSAVIVSGISLAVWLFFWLAPHVLDAVLRNLPWLYDSIKIFVGGIGVAAIMGQLTASVMVLYLSDQSENRLQRIHATLRSTRVRPWLLYATIAAGAVALLALSYRRVMG